MTRNPESLVSALHKLAAAAKPFSGASYAVQHLFFVDPQGPDSGTVPPILLTHPDVEDRIARLRDLGA